MLRRIEVDDGSERSDSGGEILWNKFQAYKTMKMRLEVKLEYPGIYTLTLKLAIQAF